MMSVSKMIGMFFKKTALSLFLVCLLVGSASMALADQTPTDRVKAATNELIEILSDPAMLDPVDHDEAITRLLKVAEKYIDFREVTKMSVGRPWLKMSSQMQKDLTDAFIQLLERSYLKRIPTYGGQNVIYKNEIVSGKKVACFSIILRETT